MADIAIITGATGGIGMEFVKAIHPSEDIDEIWASNYVRAMQTAKYIAYNNNIKINISSAFDERHYGTFESDIDFEEFWINQFKNKELKNEDGESQLDVQNRIGKKIKDIISKFIYCDIYFYYTIYEISINSLSSNSSFIIEGEAIIPSLINILPL